jgi:opacity protein-like surface antigen
MVMMKRMSAVHYASAVAVLLLAGAANADAQIFRAGEPRNAVGFNLGYFALRGEDSRVDDDVLLADLTSLAFDVKDFNGANVGGEFVFGLGDYLEAGVGVNFYQRTVPSAYADFESDDGFLIEQDLKLRVIPISATVRFLPIGRGGVEPYVGAGIGVFNWRYSEVGEFVDFSDDSIFRDRYVANGTAIGPVVLGGVRFPVADVWTIGGEVRYQKAEGKDLLDAGLLGDKIDLGGWTTSLTFHLRF